METQDGREPGFMGWVKYLWAEGLLRKLIVDKEGANVVRLPLTVIVAGALVAPWLIAIGLVIAVVTGHRVSITRDTPSGEEPVAEDADGPPPPPAPPSPEATTP
jgi:hypothetical protein